MKAKRKRLILLAAAALAALAIWIAWGNSALVVSRHTVTGAGIPEGLDGLRVVQVSDLHNAEFGDGNARLLGLIAAEEPDIIVLTGDLVDSYRTDIGVSLAFAARAAELAPTYFVTGNHEARIGEYAELRDGLESAGVTVLENERVELAGADGSVSLIGLNDPSFLVGYLTGDSAAVADTALRTLMDGAQEYVILLSHRPELFDVYVQNGADLVLSGHAHGGQFRLPFVGGLIAPGQGLFPKYDAGLFTRSGTDMIVSRGLGNSLFPFRVNNRPELVVVELESGDA